IRNNNSNNFIPTLRKRPIRSPKYETCRFFVYYEAVRVDLEVRLLLHERKPVLDLECCKPNGGDGNCCGWFNTQRPQSNIGRRHDLEQKFDRVLLIGMGHNLKSYVFSLA